MTFCSYCGVFVLHLFKQVCLICGVFRSPSLEGITALFELQCETADLDRAQSPFILRPSFKLSLFCHFCQVTAAVVEDAAEVFQGFLK